MTPSNLNAGFADEESRHQHLTQQRRQTFQPSIEVHYQQRSLFGVQSAKIWHYVHQGNSFTLVIRQIRSLLYEQGFTIGGARNRLGGEEARDDLTQAQQIVRQIRVELEEVLRILRR